jgi:hypothetical protein
MVRAALAVNLPTEDNLHTAFNRIPPPYGDRHGLRQPGAAPGDAKLTIPGVVFSGGSEEDIS